VFTYLLYRENLESGVENTVESSQTRSLNNFNISSILNCAFVSILFLYHCTCVFCVGFYICCMFSETISETNEAVDGQSR